MIFARKINKIPERYMIFARKMPEFFKIIARKIFFPARAPPAPVSYAYDTIRYNFALLHNCKVRRKYKKWRAVAAQTARRGAAVKYYPYSRPTFISVQRNVRQIIR